MPATISLPLLDQVRIASPCPARWEDMVGDAQVRHCTQCDLDVHNLSAMTRDQAEGVLAKLAEGRVCARFFRRVDGTILVQDCPVGLAKVRAKARAAMLRIAALIGLVATAGIAAASTSQTTWGDRLRLRALKPFSTVCAWIVPVAPPAPPLYGGRMVMGDLCAPPPPLPQGSGGGNAPQSAPESPETQSPNSSR